MNTCSTCKWWGDAEEDAENNPPTGYKTCMHVKIGDYSQWIDDEKPSNDDNLADDALTSCWQEMGAPLSGPNFGCVHWEQKNDKV